MSCIYLEGSRLTVCRVPPNLVFEVDDLEAPWLYSPDSYDFIHCRFMFLAIKDFPRLLEQAYRQVRLRLRLCPDTNPSKDSQTGRLY